MGKRVSTKSTAPASPAKAALLLVLGIILTILGSAIVLTFVGMLLFGGLNLFEEVGHTGDATGPTVLGIAVVGGMIAAGGVSLVRPALARQQQRYHDFTPAAYQRERLVVIVLAVLLAVVAIVWFLAQTTPLLSLGIGVAQVALAVYSLVRLRSVARGSRWQYVVAAVVSLLVNPITVLAIFALASLVAATIA